MQKTNHHTTVTGAEGDIMAGLRPLLTTYAYNITGSLEDARDLVQDAYVQLMQTQASVENLRAYLVRTVINLSINKKTQRKRTVYPGEWLPEPVITEQPDSSLLTDDVLRYSLLVLLERLNPRERAVFILREAYDYAYDEIATVLDISAANARQLLSRARKQVQHPPPAPASQPPAEFLQKYLTVMRQGDATRLEKMLFEDVTATSDGGGKVVSARQPVYGREAVLAMIMGMFKKFYHSSEVRPGLVNHQPALFYYYNGKVSNCQVFTLDETGITEVYFIRNPNKLKVLPV